MTTFSFLANNHCGVVAVNVLGWEGSRKGWDCHCCSVSVFIRLQEHDSLYASLRLQPQHRVAGGCVCALPAHSLIHTYVTVLIRSPSLFLTRFLSLLSPVLLISRGGFCFPPEVSEWALVGELCHSMGARLCHPEITCYTLWFLLILYSGHVPSALNEISHTFRKVGTKRSSTLFLLICT